MTTANTPKDTLADIDARLADYEQLVTFIETADPFDPKVNDAIALAKQAERNLRASIHNEKTRLVLDYADLLAILGDEASKGKIEELKNTHPDLKGDIDKIIETRSNGG